MEASQIILFITQGVVIAFLAFEKAYKLIKGNGNTKKNNRGYYPGNNPHPCQQHGERIAGVETDLKNLRYDNQKEHGNILKEMEKLEEKLERR